MSIARITYGLPRFALFVLIIAALIYGPRPAFAQTTDSSGEQAQGAQSVSGAYPSSDQASKAQQQASTHSAICGESIPGSGYDDGHVPSDFHQTAINGPKLTQTKGNAVSTRKKSSN